MFKKPFMLLTNGLVWFFILSHIAGWVLTNVQTSLIIHEIRKLKNK